jgi:uncharacterized protein YjbJ (UPF0337 family)
MTCVVRPGMHDALAALEQRRLDMGSIKDKIKGKLMKTEGRVTGDKVRETQGKAVEAKGKVKGAIERGVSKVKATKAKMQRKMSAARRTP